MPGDPIVVPMILTDHARLSLSLRKQAKTMVIVLTGVIESSSLRKKRVVANQGWGGWVTDYAWHRESPETQNGS